MYIYFFFANTLIIFTFGRSKIFFKIPALQIITFKFTTRSGVLLFGKLFVLGIPLHRKN